MWKHCLYTVSAFIDITITSSLHNPFSFPVESMVIRPQDGKVLSHINANKLLDSASGTVLESIMYVPILV